MGVLARVVWFAIALGSAGCFDEPDIDALARDCQVRCSASGDCPDGHSCFSGVCAKSEAAALRCGAEPRRSLSVGDRHACVVEAGTLLCWGDNRSGQAGGAARFETEPTLVEHDDQLAWLEVSAGGEHSCAIDEQRNLWCWGSNRFGQVTGSGREDQPLTQVSALEDVVDVSAGRFHTCAITAVGELFCWGRNDRNELGLGDDAPLVDGPRSVEAGDDGEVTRWASASAGAASTCALSYEGRLFCWGDNSHGQVGQGTTGDLVELPVEVDGTYHRVAVGARHACALRATDAGTAVDCWGDGRVDQSSGESSPAAAEIGSGARELAVGDEHSCAGSADAIECVGEYRDGRLGSESLARGPQQVALGGEIAELSAGGATTCARSSEGSVSCWGSNDVGQRGIGSMTAQLAPVRVGAGGWTSVDAGFAHTCATNAGELVCWGANADGQIGGSAPAIVTNADDGESLGTVTAYAAGHDQTCFELGGTISCIGGLEFRVNGTITPLAMVGGLGFGCAVNGGVLCWGGDRPQPQSTSNGGFVDAVVAATNDSEVGIARVSNGDVVVETTQPFLEMPMLRETFAGATDALAFAMADEHACVVVRGPSGDDLVCFGIGGDETFFQLGAESVNPGDSVVVIEDTAVDVVAGRRHSCGFGAAGIVCWGDDSLGQVGAGDAVRVLPAQGTQTMSPAGVQWRTPSDDTQPFRTLSAGANHTCAIDNAQNLFCWGSNSAGQLGNAAQLPPLTPTEVDLP